MNDYKWWIIGTFVLVLLVNYNQVKRNKFEKNVNRIEHHIESLNLELTKTNQKCDSLMYHIKELENKN